MKCQRRGRQQQRTKREKEEDDDEDDVALLSFRQFGRDLDLLLKRGIHFIYPPQSYDNDQDEIVPTSDGQFLPKSLQIIPCHQQHMLPVESHLRQLPLQSADSSRRT